MSAALRELLAAITQPPEKATPTEWAERHADLSAISHIPGLFRRDNSPATAAVMDAIADPAVREVSVVACVQSGKSLAPALALAYLIATAPGPALWLDVTDEKAKLASESRLRPLFEHCPPVAALFNADKNKMRNATMIFSNGMSLWINGANNRKNLQSRSIRYLFGDETWQWERGRMAEARARTTAFARGKCVFFSQAGLADDDTDRAFLATNRAEWSFACARCGETQPFVWENLRWDPSAKNAATGAWDFARVRESVRLVCPHCGHALAFSPATLRALNASARFVAQNPLAPSTLRGFHWNALATMDWRDLAVQFLSAKAIARRGDISELRTFYQQRLALPWKDDDEAEALVETAVNEGQFILGEPWAAEAFFDPATARVVPAGAPDADAALLPRLRFLTVDVQNDFFYWALRLWSANGSSRLHSCGIAQTFDELRAVRAREKVYPVFTFVDCGFRTPQVLAFCARHNFTALRGSALNEWNFPGKTKAYFSPRENVAVGNGFSARRHFFSNQRMKDILHELRSGRAAARWEIPRNAPAHYIKQLSAERRNADTGIWEQIGHRPNHFFDCETMQVCAAVMLSLVGRAAPPAEPKEAES